jgi:glycosyltransferase involved in cell wall biosynthesis
VVLPSYYPEGTPRSLLEAAASAKPLITCDVTGCREVVRDGVNGVLIQPRDAGALEAAMRHMLALEPGTLAALGQASRLEAEARFDERIVIRRYVEEIRAALSGAQPN